MSKLLQVIGPRALRPMPTRVAALPTQGAHHYYLHTSAIQRQGRPSRGKDDDDDEDAGGSLFSQPRPPPLPPQEQREFEKLVREKANAPQFKPASVKDDKHPQYRAKPTPEFEGEANPETGEVGGPKNDPLKWEREWTYGGRSTDF